MKQLTILRCDYCDEIVAELEIIEDIFLELTCSACGRVSEFIIYKIY